MGASAKAMMEGMLDRGTVGHMLEKALGVDVGGWAGDGAGYVIATYPDRFKPKVAFHVHHGIYDDIGVGSGMRTVVSGPVTADGEAALRAVLAQAGGYLCKDDSKEEWEHVPATDAFGMSPDQELQRALHALSDPRDVTALVRVCADPERRAALEAALVARREAEPDPSFSP